MLGRSPYAVNMSYSPFFNAPGYSTALHQNYIAYPPFSQFFSTNNYLTNYGQFSYQNDPYGISTSPSSGMYQPINYQNPKPPKLTSHIDTEDVNQGGHGDCVFEASLASLTTTASGRQQIKNIIKDNRDGTYTVTFPGDSRNSVNITEYDIQNKKSDNAEGWAKIIETAFMKAYPKQAEGDYPAKLNGKPLTPAQQALHLLTGRDAAKTNADADNIEETLDSKLNRRTKSMVAYCKNDAYGTLVQGHEWTVKEYDPVSKTVVLRNPWGHNPIQEGETTNGITGLNDGQVKMSVKEFKKYFQEVTFV